MPSYEHTTCHNIHQYIYIDILAQCYYIVRDSLVGLRFKINSRFADKPSKIGNSLTAERTTPAIIYIAENKLYFVFVF